MKNVLIISTTEEELLSNVNDGTNRLFINGAEIPSSSWVGTGNYTATVEGHAITIAKIDTLDGNISLAKTGEYTYAMKRRTPSSSTGVESIVQTTTSHEDGGTNIVTCTLTDGTETEFEIRNGNKGSTGETGATGATGATAMTASVDANTGTPAVTVTKSGTAENPSFALAFQNLKGAKGDTGTGGNPYVMGSKITYDADTQVLTCSKTTTAWDREAYSKVGYIKNAFVTFKPSQASGCYVMAGLASIPSASASYDTIDYAWYVVGDGTLQIYESGSYISTHGYYDTSTELRIVYDNGKVKYYKNNELMREVARSATTALFFDSCFYSAGSLKDLYFGTGIEGEGLVCEVTTADCNTITKTGYYSFGGGSTSISKHYPLQSSGTLIVCNASAFVAQIYCPNGSAGADLYMRTSVDGGANWLAWAKYNALIEADNPSDANTLFRDGRYAVGSTVANLPVAGIGVILVESCSAYVQQIYINSDIVGNGAIYTRLSTNRSTWSPWVGFNSKVPPILYKEQHSLNNGNYVDVAITSPMRTYLVTWCPYWVAATHGAWLVFTGHYQDAIVQAIGSPLYCALSIVNASAGGASMRFTYQYPSNDSGVLSIIEL